MLTNMLASSPLGQASGAFFDTVKRQAAGNEKAARAGALVLVREIKLELSKPGSGRIYGTHQASAPGQPPAVDTGVLRNSIDFEVLEAEQKVRVGSGVDYAPLLEFGTPRILPRPFMRAAFERAKTAMGRDAAAELRRGTPKGAK